MAEFLHSFQFALNVLKWSPLIPPVYLPGCVQFTPFGWLSSSYWDQLGFIAHLGIFNFSNAFCDLSRRWVHSRARVELLRILYNCIMTPHWPGKSARQYYQLWCALSCRQPPLLPSLLHLAIFPRLKSLNFSHISSASSRKAGRQAGRPLCQKRNPAGQGER